MYKIVGVVFKEHGGRTYYFSSNDIEIEKSNTVIVETEKGLQIAKAVTDVFEEIKENLVLPLKRVIRIATEQDLINYEKNLKEEQKAMDDCLNLIKKYKLNMRLIDAKFTFDKKQLIFHFISDDRVDFRDLAKDLAQIYKTRIELRQVGVRDKSKEVGGIGPCGRLLCCSTFLNDFESVSINMAKNQQLALNPSKINGVCGRLLCCLNYEDEIYKEYRKDLPDYGKRVKIPQGEGKVISVDILNRKYKVDIPEKGIVEIELEK
jgi:cell fate regulator YaaT (PSP1 superfamily)